MEVITETWYKAVDGIRYKTELECLKHELEIEQQKLRDATKKKEQMESEIDSIMQEIAKKCEKIDRLKAMGFVRKDGGLKVTEITTEVNFFGR